MTPRVESARFQLPESTYPFNAIGFKCQPAPLRRGGAHAARRWEHGRSRQVSSGLVKKECNIERGGGGGRHHGPAGGAAVVNRHSVYAVDQSEPQCSSRGPIRATVFTPWTNQSHSVHTPWTNQSHSVHAADQSEPQFSRRGPIRGHSVHTPCATCHHCRRYLEAGIRELTTTTYYIVT